MDKSREQQLEEIQPGMDVEATATDIGELDVSKPKVVDVIKDDKGDVEKVVIKKGVLFSKEIEIPVERVLTTEADDTQDGRGKVIIKAVEPEVEALGASGKETLTSDGAETNLVQNNWMDNLQEAIPTEQGLRQMEARNASERYKGEAASTLVSDSGLPKEPTKTPSPKSLAHSNNGGIWQIVGPGFLGGMSGNDSSAVTAYAVDGAQSGYGHLWLMLLSTPLWQAVLYACGSIGRVTQKGFADLLRENYGRKVALPTSLLLIIGNTALIAGDLVAIGSGLELITNISWIWFVIPVAVALWYITVYQSFDTIKKIFTVLSLAFIAYIVTAIISGADWGAVLNNTFVPHLDFSLASISSAVAILGATMSPYTMFWQIQGEKEEKRKGTTQQQLKTASLDIGTGVVGGNLISYFIIVATSATLFTHQKQITTAADAASALEPLAGPLAKYLFATGLIGAGLVAIPILLASTSYGLSGTFHLPASLSKKPWQNEGFYLFLTVGLLVSLLLALLHFDPIQLMFWANILQAFLAPILIVLILILGNSRKIMGRYRLRWLTNSGLVLTALLLMVATTLLVYGIVTGQSGS